jgi:hypothetical protein
MEKVLHERDCVRCVICIFQEGGRVSAVILYALILLCGHCQGRCCEVVACGSITEAVVVGFIQKPIICCDVCKDISY